MAQRGACQTHPYMPGLALDRAAVSLHTRRMPDGPGMIDEIAVTPAGVFVVEHTDVRGKVRIARPLFGATRLLVDGWDRTKALDGVDRQVRAVRHVLGAAGHRGLAVQGAICFARADMPLLRTQYLRGHCLLCPKALARRVNAEGPLDAVAIRSIGRELALAFPPA